MRLPGFLFASLMALLPLRAQEPLIDLPLAGDLVNRGTLGGEAVILGEPRMFGARLKVRFGD